MTPRLLAYQLLQKAERNKQYSNIILDQALERSGMSAPDKALAATLFYGVTERKITLDYRISQLSSRPLKDLDGEVLCALRLGLYQLIYLDRIPDHAAINETVALCSKRSGGFVNAVLRAHTRTPMGEIKCDGDAEELSIRYSVCTALAERFIRTFGKEFTEEILKSFSVSPDIAIRTNTLKLSREKLLSELENGRPTENSPVGILTKGAVRGLYGFDEGAFFVQDEASQICVEALAPEEGQFMLDICSCPGSKSFGAAIKMNNEGRIISFDLHENKLSLVRSGASRLGIDIIETKAADGRKFIPEFEGKADRVLCDVPCSGFGVLAKKPELRHKDPEESASLPQIQRAILENACRYVKHGGVLVYSTCTLLPEENQQNVEDFLSSHSEFTLTPWRVGNISADGGMITLFPHVHGTDGFFIAKLTRK